MERFYSSLNTLRPAQAVALVFALFASGGGGFSSGLALGRSQSDDAAPETALFQQRFSGGQISSDGLPGGRLPGGGSTGGQFGGAASDGPPIRSESESPAGQDAPTGSRGGASGGRGGFGGILNGTVGTVSDNGFTVTTESGETQVSLDDASTIQVYETGTAGDLSPGDRVLVIVSGDVESGEPVDAASVIVNPPEGGGVFGGGRPRSP